MNSSEIIFEVVESLDGGFEARAIGHSIFTEAESQEQLKERISDALLCHFADGTKFSYIIRRVSPYSEIEVCTPSISNEPIE